MSKLRAVWQALNYLCVSQLYLRSNILLERPLAPGDLKRRIVGHWGSAPGINFILAQLSLAAKDAKLAILPVIGTGHAATSMLAWLYLEGSLGEAYPELVWSRAGIEALVSSFGGDGLFRTELSAFMPGTVIAGGEIGPAHAVAQGVAMDQPDARVACVVGDGELETGPALSGLMAARELACNGVDPPLLVVNLNQHRMGDVSLLGRMAANEREAFFQGFGYQVWSTELGDSADTNDAFSAAFASAAPLRAILVNSRKGVTFPEVAGRFAQVVGTPRAHKAPLVQPWQDPEELALLEEWLKSYRPSELFSPDGVPSQDIREVLPKQERRIGRLMAHLCGPRPLAVPAGVKPPVAARTPMASVEDLLTGILEQPVNRGRVRLFCPDELRSNHLDGLGRRFPDRVLEILSEDTCQGWAEGYVRSGRHALIVSYEAFAARFSSQFAQHLKFSEDCRTIAFRPETPSMNYLLTSLAWHNVYSHQNPDFVSTLLLRESPVVRVVFPVNGDRLAVLLGEMIGSFGRINAVVASKYAIGPRLGSEIGAILDRDGCAIHSSSDGRPRLILAAAGDVAAASVVAAAERLRSGFADCRVQVVLVEDVARLSAHGARALDAETYRLMFGDDQPVLFAFNAYPATMKAILAERPNARHFRYFGYRDRSGHDFQSNLESNGMAPDQLAMAAASLLRSEQPA